MTEASDYAKAVAERDEAIAERDYIMDFFIELGEALLGKSRVIQPPAQGVDVRSLTNLPRRALRALRSLVRRIVRRGPMQ